MSNVFCVPCLLGVEGLVADELKFNHFEKVQAENGRVYFEGEMKDAARANIIMRCGERVLLRLASFRATTFDELFEGTKAIPWEAYVQTDSAFPVKGYSIGSQLHSVPNCQKIIKKAAVSRLSQAYGINWFEETGVKYQIQFSLMNDLCEIYLDTTGTPLYKRGYRTAAGEAPLRETLAASLVKIARYRGREEMIDPMCGSGTIAIEAAMAAAKIMPGARRAFDAEAWAFYDTAFWQQLKEEAIAGESYEKLPITASDISAECVQLTMDNAKRAGVADLMTIRRADALGVHYTGRKGVLITNPPYGQRLLDVESAAELADDFGKALADTPDLKKYIISMDEQFEEHFGHKATKRRKLYNGMLKCQLYMYYNAR